MGSREEGKYSCYWKVKGSNRWWSSYAYADLKPHLAEELFAREGIKVRFRHEMIKEGVPYCIVFCKVRSKHTEQFRKTMEQLKEKIQLLGYEDYPEFCKEIMNMILDAGSDKK